MMRNLSTCLTKTTMWLAQMLLLMSWFVYLSLSMKFAVDPEERGILLLLFWSLFGPGRPRLRLMYAGLMIRSSSLWLSHVWLGLVRFFHLLICNSFILFLI